MQTEEQQALEMLNNIRKQASVPYDIHAQADQAYEILKRFVAENSKSEKPQVSKPKDQ